MFFSGAKETSGDKGHKEDVYRDDPQAILGLVQAQTFREVIQELHKVC